MDFAGFVAGRGRALWRAAWLLTGDAAMAEDLVQTALAKSVATLAFDSARMAEDAETLRVAAMTNWRSLDGMRCGLMLVAGGQLAILRTRTGDYAVLTNGSGCGSVSVGPVGGPLRLLGLPGGQLIDAMTQVDGPY